MKLPRRSLATAGFCLFVYPPSSILNPRFFEGCGSGELTLFQFFCYYGRMSEKVTRQREDEGHSHSLSSTSNLRRYLRAFAPLREINPSVSSISFVPSHPLQAVPCGTFRNSPEPHGTLLSPGGEEVATLYWQHYLGSSREAAVARGRCPQNKGKPGKNRPEPTKKQPIFCLQDSPPGSV